RARSAQHPDPVSRRPRSCDVGLEPAPADGDARRRKDLELARPAIRGARRAGAGAIGRAALTPPSPPDDRAASLLMPAGVVSIGDTVVHGRATPPDQSRNGSTKRR